MAICLEKTKETNLEEVYIWHQAKQRMIDWAIWYFLHENDISIAPSPGLSENAFNSFISSTIPLTNF